MSERGEVTFGDALHSANFLTLRFCAQKQTGTHQLPIYGYGAGATVAGAAAFLGAGQT